VTSPSSGDDETLLSQIREVAGETEVMGDAMRRAAREAFRTRVRDAGRLLAQLSYDSVLDNMAIVRGPGSADRRIVTFDAPTLSVEVEITRDCLLGQVVPSSPAEIELMTLDGVVERVSADARGCFVLSTPQPGPIRFGCRTGGELVVTDWVRV
jgi:hypothetical protein